MATILVLNGPNLNMLGIREPGIYGHTTLQSIDAKLKDLGEKAGHEVVCVQSNAEHALVDRIHQALGEGVAYIVFNPAAFTHTSVALRDALLATGIPFIEIHLSNVHARDDFRKQSYFSDIAQGVIAGFGPMGYEMALTAAVAKLSDM